MRCGVGDYTAKLGCAIKDSGKADVIFLSSLGQPIALRGVELIQIRNWSVRLLPEILRILSACRPDIVHIQFPSHGYAPYWLPWTLPLVLRVVGFRVVQTWHEFLPMGGHKSSLLPSVACDTAIVVRPHFRQNISSWYRLLLRRKEIVYIPGASSIPRSRLSAAQREQLHADLRQGQDRVVTYFGFANPNKGVELIFRIADPRRDRIVLVCDLAEENPYQRGILSWCDGPDWRGKATVTGFLPADQVADVLAVSDAVVLPFPAGGGRWNSSISAALEQGTLVITTSDSENGYDPVSNIFYCRPGDVESMARALATYGGRKNQGVDSAWNRIAAEHLQVYGRVLTRGRARST
jgi:glycosyltransferase involved in cell wall biosynthesis